MSTYQCAGLNYGEFVTNIRLEVRAVHVDVHSGEIENVYDNYRRC